jgi:hypothetical protein
MSNLRPLLAQIHLIIKGPIDDLLILPELPKPLSVSYVQLSSLD